MNRPSRTLNRRKFLTLVAATTVSALAGFVVVKRNPIRLVIDKLRYNNSPYQLNSQAATGVPAETEMANLLNLAGALIPWAQGEATVREMTREYVEGRSRFEPGALAAFVETSRLLDRAADDVKAGARFSALDVLAREKVVADIIPRPIRSRRDWRHVYNVLFRYEETRATELVVSGILTNFYEDDRSWEYLRGS